MFEALKAVLLSLALSMGLAGPSTAVDPPAAATTGSPAIWTLTKANGKTITFFGSVHLLPQAQNWRIPAFTSAFDKADVVVFETPISDADMSGVQALIQEEGMNPPGVTLSTLLKPDEKADVEKAVTLVGGTFALLEAFRPWLAGVQLSVAFAVKEGMDPNAGVDKTVEGEAKTAGKQLDYFETTIEQMQIFTGMKPAEEIAFLVIGAREMVQQPNQLKELLDAWASGNVAAIDKMMNDGMETMPDLATKMIDARNARWVDKISAQYMTDDKNYLVIVGAAHLAGAKSVIAMLRAKGADISGP